MERFWIQTEHETDVEEQGGGVTILIVVVEVFSLIIKYNYRCRGLSTPSQSPFSAVSADEDDPGRWLVTAATPTLYQSNQNHNDFTKLPFL